MDLKKRSEEVLATIRAMNRCWTEGWNEQKFREYIHPEAVAIVPATSGRLEGQDVYIAGWRAFCEAAVIHEWRETDHKVQLYTGGKSAVVTYLFTITFVTGSQKQTMQGRDMFLLIKKGRKWQVVADQFSPEPIRS
jgi:hypothetical protein